MEHTPFDKLKNRLIGSDILAFPTDDIEYELHTDASSVGLGGILMQWQSLSDDSKPVRKIISYILWTLDKAEKNYYTSEQECFAIVFAIKRLRPYL